MPIDAATPRHVELHQRTSQLWLENDDESQEPDDRRCIEHPARNEQIELTSEQGSDAQSQNDQRHSERAGFTATSKEEIDADREDDEVDDTLPASVHEDRSGAPGVESAGSSVAA